MRWLATLLVLTACTKPFRWQTSDGLSCDAALPDGGVALNDLECNRAPDWDCQSDPVPVDGGASHACWRVVPELASEGGFLWDGPWVMVHGCCCEPDCGHGSFPATATRLVCEVNGAPPPQPMQCIDGGVVWPAQP